MIAIPKNPKILGDSVKVRKGEKLNILTAIAYLAPHTRSGANLCPWATRECAAACLGHSAGRLSLGPSQRAQLWKSRLWLENRALFEEILDRDVQIHLRKASKLGMIPAVRLNGSTDILPSWKYAREYPDAMWYDYTKDPARMSKFLDGAYPENFHLTFSFSGYNGEECRAFLERSGNVAVVFTGPLPDSFSGAPVIDADESDARFLDPPGTIAGLSVKGRHDTADNPFFVEPSRVSF